MYSIKLYIGITVSISSTLSMSVLFILVMHLVNGAHFLNVTPLSLLSACLAAASFPAPVIVLVAFTSMYECA